MQIKYTGHIPEVLPAGTSNDSSPAEERIDLDLFL